MAWQLKGTGDEKLIMNGATVVGSVRRQGVQVGRMQGGRMQGATMSGWRVEVLWSGGDIVYDAPTLMAAQAFIAGVERTMEAMEMG